MRLKCVSFIAFSEPITIAAAPKAKSISVTPSLFASSSDRQRTKIFIMKIMYPFMTTPDSITEDVAVDEPCASGSHVEKG